MSIKRSRFEIIMELLTQVHNGNCLPTRLMHSTNLSWNTLSMYTDSLVVKGLLVEDDGGGDNRSKTRFHITERGERLLEYLGLTLDPLSLEDSCG
jgi:predicted transcriptional regulator